MRQRNLLFVYASSEKNLREKKEPSLLERTSFLLRFGEHRDNSRNSQSVFLVVLSCQTSVRRCQWQVLQL